MTNPQPPTTPKRTPAPALWPTAHQAILAGQSPAIPGPTAPPQTEQADIVSEIVKFRLIFIEGYIDRRINHRDGDFTTEQYDAWWSEAHRAWRERFPVMASMLPTHIWEEASSGV